MATPEHIDIFHNRDPFWVDKTVIRAVVMVLAMMAGLYGTTRLWTVGETPNPLRRPIERTHKRPIMRRMNKRYEYPSRIMAAGVRG